MTSHPHTKAYAIEHAKREGSPLTGYAIFFPPPLNATGSNPTLPDASKLPPGTLAIRLDGDDERVSDGVRWEARIPLGLLVLDFAARVFWKGGLL